MTETLYHKDLGFPRNFVKPTGKVMLEWTRHALAEAEKDRYGRIPTWKCMTLNRFDVIEIGVVGGTISKYVLRGKLDDTNDAVVVLIPGTEKWRVKTIWINRRDDKHKTLDKSRYAAA
jgi:hypothetical protein